MSTIANGTRIPASMFRPHPLNPRLEFNRLPPPPGEAVEPSETPTMNRLQSLAESIRQSGGHPFTPILARPQGGRYEIVCGHTRFRAMTEILGFTELEVGLDVVLREMDEGSAVRMMVDDNLRRWAYNGGELARALKLLVSNLKMSERDIARQYNVSVGWISTVLSLNRLPARVAAKISVGQGHALARATEDVHSGERLSRGEGKLTIKHGLALANLETNDQKVAVARAIEKNRLTVRETNQVVEALRENPCGPVDEVVRAVKRNNATANLNTLIVELPDSRVVEALARAAGAAKIGREEYAATKIAEGLVNDGYLRPEVLQQDEVLQFVEEKLGTMTAPDDSHLVSRVRMTIDPVSPF
jgi:ParB/RepB/Spo0J family partition protein